MHRPENLPKRWQPTWRWANVVYYSYPLLPATVEARWGAVRWPPPPAAAGSAHAQARERAWASPWGLGASRPAAARGAPSRICRSSGLGQTDVQLPPQPSRQVRGPQPPSPGSGRPPDSGSGGRAGGGEGESAGSPLVELRHRDRGTRGRRSASPCAPCLGEGQFFSKPLKCLRWSGYRACLLSLMKLSGTPGHQAKTTGFNCSTYKREEGLSGLNHLIHQNH